MLLILHVVAMVTQMASVVIVVMQIAVDERVVSELLWRHVVRLGRRELCSWFRWSTAFTQSHTATYTNINNAYSGGTITLQLEFSGYIGYVSIATRPRRHLIRTIKSINPVRFDITVPEKGGYKAQTETERHVLDNRQGWWWVPTKVITVAVDERDNQQRPTQPSIPPGSVNEYQLRLGRQRQVWFILLADKRGVCR